MADSDKELSAIQALRKIECTHTDTHTHTHTAGSNTLESAR